MKRKSEIFDYLQYFYDATGYSDHQLHCIISFRGKINGFILRKAITLLLRTIPILSSTYINLNGRSYWKPATSPLSDYFLIVSAKKDFDAFTVSRIWEQNCPQIKLCLYSGIDDSLSVIINHMVTDGAGLKLCLYQLSEIYSKLLKNPDYIPSSIIDGDRSFHQVLSSITFKKRLELLLNSQTDNNQDSTIVYPMDKDTTISPFILTYTLYSADYQRILTFCKKHRATVNDVILTAFFRVLSKKLCLEDACLHIPIMIDMRRYLHDKGFYALTNLTSTVIIKATISPTETFQQSLQKISEETNTKKNHFMGFNVFLKLETLFHISTTDAAYHLLKKSLRHPKICMTNIGIIDSNKLAFGTTPIKNAYIIGSIKYRPYFQLAVSSYEKNMNLCVNLYGSEQDRIDFQDFLNAMYHELKLLY